MLTTVCRPVILAALTSGDPILLIGRSGTGKTFLLNSISEALGLEHRHYNASLISFDDLVVTSFNAGVGSTTLPIFIYSAIKFGVTPEINAISTIIIAIVALALFVAWRLGAFRSERRLAVEEDAALA